MSEWEKVCDSSAGIGLRIIIDSKRDEDFLNEKAGGIFEASQFWNGGIKGGYYLSIRLRKDNGSTATVGNFEPLEWVGIRVLF